MHSFEWSSAESQTVSVFFSCRKNANCGFPVPIGVVLPGQEMLDPQEDVIPHDGQVHVIDVDFDGEAEEGACVCVCVRACLYANAHIKNTSTRPQEMWAKLFTACVR